MWLDRPLLEIVERATAARRLLPAAYAQLFEKITHRDSALHSMCDPTWSWIEEELARLDALLDAGASNGLAGVPIGVKDTIVVEGLPTKAGTRADLGELLSLRPSPAVVALQDAGAVVVGKQATHQFASSAGPAPTLSVRGAEHFAGGSTVGGAVAVAAGFTTLALGTDGGGSVRKPAALAGVAGLHMKKGMISDDGQINGAVFGQSTGLIARSVEDITAVLERCPRLLRAPLAPCAPGSLVVGLPDVARTGISPEAAHALQAAADRLAEMGHAVVPVRLWSSEEAMRDFLLAVHFDNWSFHARLLAEHPEIYKPAVAQVMRQGETIDRKDAAAAKERLAGHRARLLEEAASQGVDVLLTPSVPWPDAQKGAASLPELSANAGRFTILANVYDLDSVSLPVEREVHGVYSVMLTGTSLPLSELLACSRQLELRRLPVG